MRVGSPLSLGAHVSAGTSSIGISLSGGAPGTPSACITPRPAPTPGTLTLRDGFTVLDPQQRRLSDQARAEGFAGLASYLQARCRQQASPAQLASELGTTTTVVRHLLDQAGISPSPRRVTAAHTRRATTDQHLAARAAELGFASLQAYLADRAMTRRWPSTTIASELRVQPATVQDRLDQYSLPASGSLTTDAVAAVPIMAGRPQIAARNLPHPSARASRDPPGRCRIPQPGPEPFLMRRSGRVGSQPLPGSSLVRVGG